MTMNSFKIPAVVSTQCCPTEMDTSIKKNIPNFAWNKVKWKKLLGFGRNKWSCMVLQTIKHRGSGLHKWKWNSQNLHKYSQGNIAVHFLQPCYHPNLLQKDGWLVDLHTNALLLFLSCSLFFLEPDFNWWHYYKEIVFSCHLFFGPKEISQIMYDLQSVFPQFQSGHVRTRSLFLSGEQHGAEGSGSSKSFRAPLGSVSWPGSSSSEKRQVQPSCQHQSWIGFHSPRSLL